MRSCIFVTAALVLGTAALNAQTYRRQATMMPAGPPDRGICVVEISVDGTAEVAVRGVEATVTNLKGQPPELLRFECSGPLPPNAAEFRFNGINGRGSQILVAPPAGDRPAVVRIDDPKNGSDRYRFELVWRAGRFESERREHRFTSEEAVNVCQDAVRRQTEERFRTADVSFRETRIDDAPGRGEWVIGFIEARRPGRPDERVRFSCSVDFATGRVRNAQIDPEMPRGEMPYERPGINPVAVRNCQAAVEEKARRDGFRRVTFAEVLADDRADHREWLMGNFEAEGRYGPERLHFACSVGMRDGDVRAVDITTRR